MESVDRTIICLKESYGKSNCLSFIKLLAAFQVMIGHLIAHLKLYIPSKTAFMLSFYMGVPIFFVISGYLIWLSIARSSSYFEYIRKRFFRIYPELWGAVVIEIISIVILYSDWNIRDLLTFTITQGTIFQFWTPNSLRRYGCGTPNGTLWTICVMMQFYIIGWMIYKLFHQKRIYVWMISLIGFIGISIVWQNLLESVGIELLTKLYAQTIIRYGWLFYFGCFIAEYREKIVEGVLVKYWWILLLIAWLVFISGYDLNAGYNVLHSIFLVSGLIGFAYAFPELFIKKDLSYGFFLYHMIVANIFIDLGWTGKWIYAIFVVLITLILSYLSNRIIGSRTSRKIIA